MLKYVITHADGSGGVEFSSAFVSLSVLPHDISKTDAAGITKLDTEMLHYESLKSVCFVLKKVKGQGHETQNSTSMGFGTT